jgi:predicted PurR-regulated permease PerM
MKPPDPNAARTLDGRLMLGLLAVVTAGFVWILLPFYGAILWASIIALLFAPLYRGLLPRCRQHATPAALLTLLAALVVVVLPLALITGALAREATGLYQRLQSGQFAPMHYLRGVFDALPLSATALLDRAGLINFDTLQQRLVTLMSEGSQFIASQALGFGQNTFELVVSLGIALYLAFFLIRDGQTLVQGLRRAIPLAPVHAQELLDKFSTVIRATVKGNLLVAMIQGALGGLAFWFLDVRAALLWAVLMAFLSLLPAVGAALVWAPVALWFLLTGAVWQGLMLVAWGMLVIGLIDNLLRPVLVGKDTQLPDYLVMISTLGGMAVFGLNGFVLGPVIAAMFVAVWHMHGAARAAARQGQDIEGL